MRDGGLKRVLHISGIVLLISVVFGYSYLEARNMLLGPHVVVTEPQNGATVTDMLLPVSGQVRNVQQISLNGRDIFIDESGNFNETVLLYPGHNRIVVEGRDRFEKQSTQTIQIVYVPQNT